MTAKIVTIDGIDGSGKATQALALTRWLNSNGYNAMTVDFPRYDSNTMGEYVGKMLRGELGDATKALHPVLATALFALDRRESLPTIRKTLETQDVLVIDRWVPCNIVYQSVREQLRRGEDRPNQEIADLVHYIEYTLLELPKPDAAFFLEINPAGCKQLLTAMGKPLDGYEADEPLQQALFEGFQHYCMTQPPRTMTAVPCTLGDSVLPAETITANIVQLLLDGVLKDVKPNHTVDA